MEDDYYFKWLLLGEAVTIANRNTNSYLAEIANPEENDLHWQWQLSGWHEWVVPRNLRPSEGGRTIAVEVLTFPNSRINCTSHDAEGGDPPRRSIQLVLVQWMMANPVAQWSSQPDSDDCGVNSSGCFTERVQSKGRKRRNESKGSNSSPLPPTLSRDLPPSEVAIATDSGVAHENGKLWNHNQDHGPPQSNTSERTWDWERI
eukprot:3868798-Rhodomonas_salina.1